MMQREELFCPTGPPYATMPMAADVDYRAFSVFINISDYSGWLQDRMEWEIHPTIRPYHVLNPWTWLPEASPCESWALPHAYDTCTAVEIHSAILLYNVPRD